MAVLGGNPAKEIRKRQCVHSDLVVESLLGGDYYVYKQTRKIPFLKIVKISVNTQKRLIIQNIHSPRIKLKYILYNVSPQIRTQNAIYIFVRN